MNKIYKSLLIAWLLLLFVTPIQAKTSYIDLPVSQSNESQYVYRYWSPVFRGHFFTMDHTEAMQVANVDTNWNFEKIAFSSFKLQAEGTIPVYRFWSPVFKGHFYTTNQDEWRRVKDTDTNWNYEWIAYYAYPAGFDGPARTVYRFWSPIFLHHFFTIDEEEMQRVRDTDSNWIYEGVAFKVPLDDTNTTNTGNEKELVEQVNTAALQIDEASDVTSSYPTNAGPGNKLIATKVYLLNRGQQPLSFNINDFRLKDNITGNYYQPGLLKEPILPAGTLEPGGSAEGYLTFELPESANELSLEYASDTMAVKNNKLAVTVDVTPTVKIISHGLVEDMFSGKKIVGVVKNNTDKPVRYVKITAKFYSVNQGLVGTEYAYAEKAGVDFLQSGETADFKVWYDSDPSVEYYLLDLDWKNN